MAQSPEFVVGEVGSIWRYPIKSMRGEEIVTANVTQRGLVGDRVLALVDVETGKVASSKNPRRWPQLFGFRSAYEEATPEQSAAIIWIVFPDGERVRSDSADVESKLASQLGRPVRLASPGPGAATTEGYWPNYDWLSQRDEVFEFLFPTNTFYDGSIVHFLTTATLHHLHSFSPGSQFEPARFRPNFVINTADGLEGFVENQWFGRTLKLGEVQLRVDRPCPRCVMTTLPQGALPKDPEVLRTAVQQNGGNVGVYASVIRGGQVRRGDTVELL